MKISWPKGMERWKAVLERYRYALLVVAVGALLLLLPTGGDPARGGGEADGPGDVLSDWRVAGGAGGEAGPHPVQHPWSGGRRRLC